LLPYLRPIWRATDYACGRRLVAMLPEWIPAYEQHERKVPTEVRDKLLEASGRTLDRLLEPLRVQGAGRCLTRPGTLLRQQIPIRGNVWEEGTAGWLEVDTVALCGGSVAGEFVWMVDGVDYATTWVEVRAMWGRGEASTLAGLRDMEASLPFALLGLDSDNGGEFLNHHVLRWLQKRPKPVFMTRSRPYKKDDNAHVEQKNWTHVRQCFGYERHDNPEVVPLINTLIQKAYGPLRNFFHASLKLERKERTPGVPGRLKRVYGKAQTPLARVLASAEVSAKTKQRLNARKGSPQSVRSPETRGPGLEGDGCHPATAPLNRSGPRTNTPSNPAVNNSPSPATPSLGPHPFDRRGARAGGSTAAPLLVLSRYRTRKTYQRTEDQNQKQHSHRVTPLLAQRIPYLG
jgi:hypothetical protein